jgi:hypothetical protein
MKGLLHVSVGLETTAEEARAIEQVFRLAEIPVLVDDEIARFSVDSPWVMFLTAELAWFSSRFARMPPDSPAEALGPGLAAFIENVTGAFNTTEGSVVFTDERSGVAVALTPELPGEAYTALLAVDLMQVEGERISWNEGDGAWFTLRGELCQMK